MKMHQKMRGGFTLVELLVVIVIIAALAGLTAPMVIKQRKKADQTEAVSNARQIGLALFEFETAYGSFPDTSTATEVKANTDTALAFDGAKANDFFRQLIAAEISQSEAMFYAKTAFTKKPDNVFNTTEKALGKGECGFGYIMNDQLAFSTAGNPARPIVVAPLAFPFESGKFDLDFYDLKAVVLRIDNSVQSIPVRRKDGLAQLGGTKTLLDKGPETVWGDTVNPTIVFPQEK